jgi:hypothetical protein
VFNKKSYSQVRVHKQLHDKPWQDWILLDGMYDDAPGSFIRDSPPFNGKGDNNQLTSTASEERRGRII